MPNLLYGLEACPLVKSELASLDFGFRLPSLLWSNRVDKFDFKYATCGDSFVGYGN